MGDTLPRVDKRSQIGQVRCMTPFDPNAAATADSGIFGLPYTDSEASLVYVPVPWEATTSYGGGTSNGPAAILEASRQVDLFDLDVQKPYEPGLFMQDESAEVRAWNEKGKAEAAKIIEVGGMIEGDSALQKSLATVNELSEKLNQFVYRKTQAVLNAGKIVAIVGGDHSVPFGALEAVAEKYPSFGVLHFDAHSDTRDAYEGFQWSHASIMRNVLDRIPAVTKLVQVGIRDVCEQEIEYTLAQKDRMKVYFDRDLAKRRFEGQTWAATALEIVDQLPKKSGCRSISTGLIRATAPTPEPRSRADSTSMRPILFSASWHAQVARSSALTSTKSRPMRQAKVNGTPTSAHACFTSSRRGRWHRKAK